MTLSNASLTTVPEEDSLALRKVYQGRNCLWTALPLNYATQQLQNTMMRQENIPTCNPSLEETHMLTDWAYRCWLPSSRYSAHTSRSGVVEYSQLKL